MKLQADRVEKPLRKLRKQVNGFGSNPRPDEVHSLRTQTRRLEATVAALAIEREKEPRRLLRLVTPVRKAAGKVRDMDVLIGHVLTLSCERGSASVVRLLEDLASLRVKSARKLERVVSRHTGEIRKRLKLSSKLMRKRLKDGSAAVDGDAAPQILITELSHWPGLDEGNLHLFRIRIKELRYMVQLNPQADEKLLQALGDVKEEIGEWHDWVELSNIAGKVLDPRSDGDLLKRIAKTAEEKLQIALAGANRLRERYFSIPDGRKASKKILPMAAGF